MQNFQLLAQGIDVTPLLLAIKRQPELFQRETFRQEMPDSMHKDTEAILLRWQISNGPDRQALDELECHFTSSWWDLPQARALVLAILQRVEGIRLGRVMIARLKPGGHIRPHSDAEQAITYVPYYNRFHLPLETMAGNWFRCAQEVIHMQAGELWWFANTVEHEVVNESTEDRLHLILDIQVCP